MKCYEDITRAGESITLGTDLHSTDHNTDYQCSITYAMCETKVFLIHFCSLLHRLAAEEFHHIYG